MPTANKTLPREVAGYDHALANGVVRRVPSRPPALLPGPTASESGRKWVVTVIVVFGAIMVIWSIFERSDSALLWLASMAVGLGAFAFVRKRGRAMSEVQLREFAAGYTTVASGNLVAGRNDREGSLPWDYRGLWVLDLEGNVLQEPDRALDPPGMYPSPSRPGKLELWTGEVWGRLYRDP